ncbi:MAG: OmpA family protein [Candidatus Cloacimonadaceae bacterium]|nr:OmpA family protein [Candidatus Cloacimonadota bacterium]
MKAHSKVFTLLVLFALWIGSAMAIEHTVGIRGGMTLPFVDMDDEVTNHIMGGINYEAWLLDYLSLGIYPYYTQLEGEKGLGSFESTLIGGDVMVKLRPVSEKLSLNFQDAAVRRISPFGQLGFGVVHHDTEAGAVDDDGFSLSAPSAALGVSLQTKWKINLDLGAQYVFANSDKLDMYEKNVSDSYLMPFIGLGYTFGGKEAKMTAKKVSSEMTSRLLRNRISMEQNFTLSGVQFEIGSAKLTAEAQNTLDEVAKAMENSPSTRVEIHGHTDNTGSLELNNRLSLQRADSVKEYLVSKGVAEYRMSTKGFGPAKPIATNDTEAGRAENRRIEFVIVK